MTAMAYSDYKYSGVDWLGNIPSHWRIASLKTGFQVKLGKMLQPDAKSQTDEFLPYLRAANIQWRSVDFSDVKLMWFSAEEIKSLLLSDGDLLVSEGGDVGRSSIFEGNSQKILFQNSVNRIRPKNGNSNIFLYYWILAVKEKGYIDVLCNKSTIAHFTAEKVAVVPVPFPPLPEQTAIAAFLDRETAKIDALVEEQKRLIALLQEKRQAVISHAVTKGLNPDAPMKDSGVEWLGEVPAHWEVKALKRFWSVTDCKHVTAEFVDEGYPVASIRECEGRYVDLSLAKQTTLKFYEDLIEGQRLPQLGDLIFTRNATVGRVAQVGNWHGLFAMGQDVCLLRKIDAEQSSDYLQFIIESVTVSRQLDMLMIGSTFKRVNVEEIRNLMIPVAPTDEQQEIAIHIDLKTRQFDDLISDAENAVKLLQERRSALISAAVTGKIDVRGLVDTLEAAQ